MSPELAFWLALALALKMAVTAGFVVAASLVAETSGPAIGAMIATLPIAAAPSYVFLALDHDTAFIARLVRVEVPVYRQARPVLSMVMVAAACAPSSPARVSGSPTSTRPASCSPARRTTAVRPRRVSGRSTTGSGVTTVPEGSETAQPQRAAP